MWAPEKEARALCIRAQLQTKTLQEDERIRLLLELLWLYAG